MQQQYVKPLLQQLPATNKPAIGYSRVRKPFNTKSTVHNGGEGVLSLCECWLLWRFSAAVVTADCIAICGYGGCQSVLL